MSQKTYNHFPSPQDILEIVATQVATRFELIDRPADLEVRLGDSPWAGKGPITNGNPLVGSFAGKSEGVRIRFPLEPPRSGRYVTVQSMSSGWLILDELEIYM